MPEIVMGKILLIKRMNNNGLRYMDKLKLIKGKFWIDYDIS